jgi:hypothetical protein
VGRRIPIELYTKMRDDRCRRFDESTKAIMNSDVDRFLEECRADPFFRNDPKAIDQIEEVLTKFYREADESPAFQEFWDQLRSIVTRREPLMDRFQALVPLIRKLVG